MKLHQGICKFPIMHTILQIIFLNLYSASIISLSLKEFWPNFSIARLQPADWQLHTQNISQFKGKTHPKPKLSMFVRYRVGIIARLHIIDPLFFLWTHKFQLKLTITRPLGRACIHNGVKIYHGKSLTISHFCPANYQNIELHVLN